MPIKRVTVIDCPDESILAEDIRSSSGVLLAREGRKVSEELKRKLVELGIYIVKIYSFKDNFALTEEEVFLKVKMNYANTLVSFKELVNDIYLGKKLDTEKIIEITEQLYMNKDDGNELIRYLDEIQKTDENTFTHCVNTAVYCMLIAKWMGLNEREIKIALQAGLLHDLGKLKIPEEILNKAGKLSEEEFEVIKKHPIYGFELITKIENIDEEVLRAALMHHERIDGSGYPCSISENEISLYARITAVADVFDAMISYRVYKKRSTPFEAFHFLKNHGLGIFDTIVLTAFMNNIIYYFVGTKVKLNNGQIGKIVYIPLNTPYLPVVGIGESHADLSKDHELEIVEMLGI